MVHTQGGARKRRSVATAGVLLFQGCVGAGPRVERRELKQWGGSMHKAVHAQGGAHKRRCTQNAVCGHRRSLVIKASRRKGGGVAVHKQVVAGGGGLLTD